MNTNLLYAASNDAVDVLDLLNDSIGSTSKSNGKNKKSNGNGTVVESAPVNNNKNNVNSVSTPVSETVATPVEVNSIETPSVPELPSSDNFEMPLVFDEDITLPQPPLVPELPTDAEIPNIMSNGVKSSTGEIKTEVPVVQSLENKPSQKAPEIVPVVPTVVQPVVDNVQPAVNVEAVQPVVVQPEERTVKTTEEDIPDVTDKSFLSEDLPDSDMINIGDEITPYVAPEGFAEILPEDEFGNVITGEEKPATFMDNVKNTLIDVKTAVVPDKKSTQQVVDIVVDQPADKVAPATTTSGTKTPGTPAATATGVAGGQTTSILDNIKDRAVGIGGKIKGAGSAVVDKVGSVVLVKPDGSIGTGVNDIRGGETFEKLKMEGTRTTSEAKVASETVEDSLKKQQEQKTVLESYVSGEKTYVEDEDYTKYLNSKIPPRKIDEIKDPKMVTPGVKRNPSFKTQPVPQELLEKTRSDANEHIATFMTNSEKDKVIQRVIEYGLIDEFRALMIDIKDADAVLGNQYTLLTYAIKNKKYDIMKYLIYKGANVNKRDNKLETPLIVATKNNDARAVAILLDARANPNMKDVYKRTPLIYCIENNYQDLGVLFIDKGADINIGNSDGEGTLSLSTRLKRDRITNSIVEKIREGRNEQE